MSGLESRLGCSKLNLLQIQNVNLTLSIIGGIGSLLAAVVVVLLVSIRAYKTVLQRLFLYGVFSTMIHEAVHFASIEERFKYPQQGQVCAALGFLTNWTTWVVCDFHVCIVGYLLCVVFYQLRGNQFFLMVQSPTRKRFIEIVCVLLSITLPLAVLWVPFLKSMYGLDESWCWIKAYKNDCNSTGLNDKLIYGYSFFEVVGLGAFVTTVGIIITYCTVASKYSNVRHLLRHIIILSLAIIIYMVLLNLMLMVDLLKTDTYKRQICFVVAANLKELIFLSGFLLTFYGPKCIKKTTSKEKLHNKEGTGKEYGTFKESDRVSAPSGTFYEIPYTGEFTSIPPD